MSKKQKLETPRICERDVGDVASAEEPVSKKQKLEVDDVDDTRVVGSPDVEIKEPESSTIPTVDLESMDLPASVAIECPVSRYSPPSLSFGSSTTIRRLDVGSSIRACGDSTP